MPRGAKASAIIFSLIETAKENDLNLYAYLTYIFKQSPNLDIHKSWMAYQGYCLHQLLIFAAATD